MQFNEKQSTPLCEIMGRNKSDKGHIDINNSWHNYTTFYYSIFKDLSNKNLRIFELGLGTNNVNLPSNMGKNGRPGASLYGWEEFFPNSEIFGADIDKDILFNTNKIKTFYCDQTNSEIIKQMWNIPELQENFDIIIEDGLHTFNANVCFFENSIHKLKQNGYFIIEDISNKYISLFINKIKEWEAKYIDCTFTLLTIPSLCNFLDNTLLVVYKKKDKMIPIILYTHSEYSFIWNATISLLEKYATGYEIYWFSDSLLNYVLPKNFIVCIYDPELNWSLRLKKYINIINSDYFIYLQEDWLLIDTVDNAKITYLVKYMEDNAIDFMMSYIRGEATFIEKSIYEGYAFFKIKGHYFQPAIWNKQLFMKILDLDIPLKNYEGAIVYNITENAKCYSIKYTNTNDVSIRTLYFPHMHAIIKGKWTFFKYPCLKALIEKCNIDTSSRGIDRTWITNFQ